MTAKAGVAGAFALCACVATGWWLTPSEPFRTPSKSELASPPHTHASASAALPEITASEAAPTLSDSQERQPAFDRRNLFSMFQLAQSSNDLGTIESGLKAWRTCAGYLGLGATDRESWLDFVLPTGLPQQERDKRAKYGRASSERCTGFAGQTQANGEAEVLSARARELGSSSERLRHAIFSHPQNAERDKALVARLSCEMVQGYPANTGSIRLISIALRDAANSRPEHLLNSTPIPAKNIAVNLAFCDLDPEECGPHSNFIGSACIQSGQCSFLREEDYWRATSSPSDFAAAQRLREALVKQVKQRDCSLLFE